MESHYSKSLAYNNQLPDKYFFAVKDRQLYIEIGYIASWIVLLSLIFLSYSGRLSEAIYYATSYMPGFILAKLFCEDALKGKKTEVVRNIIFMSTAVCVSVYLCIFLTGFSLNDYNVSLSFFCNPVLILLLAAIYCFVGKKIENLFKTPPNEPKTVEFISERKKVVLEINAIKYVESNNDCVYVKCTNGLSYRTKRKISSWQEFLGDGFIRVHRAFLVNRSHVEHYNGSAIHIAGEDIPCSRSFDKSKLIS